MGKTKNNKRKNPSIALEEASSSSTTCTIIPNPSKKPLHKESSDETKEKESTSTTTSSSSTCEEKKKGKGSGLDDIDDLFATKKQKVSQQKEEEAQQEAKYEAQRALFKQNASSSNTNHLKIKSISMQQDRGDVGQLDKGEWAKDGLGGVFDKEGFTGRTEDGSGYKIFKAHLFNKKGFGTTKDCPFDCDCCFI